MESNDRAAKRRRTTDEGPPQHLPIDPDPGRSEARHLDSLQTHQPKVPSPTPLEHAVAPPLGAEERALDPATAPGSTVYYSSSVYVDAFNLALDTMLEDEAHLFSWRERGVFACWRGLEYEAQHL
jgi:Fanconi-associated nuclease 1